MTFPAPSPSPSWTPPAEIPDWYLRAAEDPDLMQRWVTEGMFWLVVAVVVGRIVKGIFTEIYPIQISQEKSKRIGRYIGIAALLAVFGLMGYLLWILSVLIRAG